MQSKIVLDLPFIHSSQFNWGEFKKSNKTANDILGKVIESLKTVEEFLANPPKWWQIGKLVAAAKSIFEIWKSIDANGLLAVNTAKATLPEGEPIRAIFEAVYDAFIEINNIVIDSKGNTSLPKWYEVGKWARLFNAGLSLYETILKQQARIEENN